MKAVMDNESSFRKCWFALVAIFYMLVFGVFAYFHIIYWINAEDINKNACVGTISDTHR